MSETPLAYDNSEIRLALIIAVTVIGVVAIIIGCLTIFNSLTVQTDREMMTKCAASGGAWEQNANGRFECRK